MAEMTDFLEQTTLDFWFNDVAYTKPSTFISWYTSGTGLETGSNANEVTELGREAISFGNSTGGARTVANTNTINIDTTGSGASSIAVTHAAVHDNATLGAGNMLAFMTLDSSGFTFSDPEPIRVDPGAINFDFPDTNGTMTNFLVDLWLSHVFGTTDATASRPSSWSLSLHTADPLQTGANEFAAASYARQSVNWTGAAAAAPWHEVDNTAAINFTNLNNTPIAWWGVFDQTGTNFLARHNNDGNPATVSPGSNATVAANTLKLRVQ